MKIEELQMVDLDDDKKSAHLITKIEEVFEGYAKVLDFVSFFKNKENQENQEKQNTKALEAVNSLINYIDPSNYLCEPFKDVYALDEVDLEETFNKLIDRLGKETLFVATLEPDVTIGFKSIVYLKDRFPDAEMEIYGFSGVGKRYWTQRPQEINLKCEFNTLKSLGVTIHEVGHKEQYHASDMVLVPEKTVLDPVGLQHSTGSHHRS